MRSNHNHFIDKDGLEWRFRQWGHHYRCACNAVFQEYGISQYGQPIILFMLEHMEDDGVIVTQRQLAAHMGVTQTTTAVSLKSLERLGCIKRTPDPWDMRRNAVEITEKGREVAKSFKEAFDRIDKVMYTGFTDQEKQQLSDLISRVCKNLEVINMDQKCINCEGGETIDDRPNYKEPGEI